MKRLTPTSYALLGLLARRSWSAYELNSLMQASVTNAYWPRAASHVYSEPKKLVELKLVTARQQDRNGRQRTVYNITAEGRKVLKQWLDSPTESFVTMSFEAMLKFLYAASSDKQSLLANLDGIEASTLNATRAVLEGTRPMVDVSLEGAHGMPYNGIALHFLADVMEAQLRWVKGARQTLEAIEDTRVDEASRELGIKSYKHLITRLEKMVDSSGEDK